MDYLERNVFFLVHFSLDVQSARWCVDALASCLFREHHAFYVCHPQKIWTRRSRN